MDQATQETLARLRAERQAEQQKEEADRVKIGDVAGGMVRMVLIVLAFVNLLAAVCGIGLFVFMTVTVPINVVAWVCCLLCVIWFNLGLLFVNGLD